MSNGSNMLDRIGSNMLGPFNRAFNWGGKGLQTLKKQKIEGIIMQTITYHLTYSKYEPRNNMNILERVKYTLGQVASWPTN